jgi:hypothetical protein
MDKVELICRFMPRQRAKIELRRRVKSTSVCTSAQIIEPAGHARQILRVRRLHVPTCAILHTRGRWLSPLAWQDFSGFSSS